MAKRKTPLTAGTVDEQDLFNEVHRHYSMATEDLEQRIPDFDKKDELFRSHIEEANWPYNSVIFDPRVFTAIFEKTSRLFANKPRGRLVPREGGDALGAKINNELLAYQWDDNERVDAMPMLAKWAFMDMNARKYGASFALSKWHFERKKNTKEKKSKVWFDGPNFKPLINRDCLPNPAYSSIKNWFQHRDYVTVEELETVNDAARTEPTYKNLDLLIDQIKLNQNKTGDKRESNWKSKNKSVKGLEDYLGRDESTKFKTIEVVTEYRDDRWITFAPKHGVILRDVPNPYDHGQIPVVMLRYYPVDDDLYGLSEIEPVERLQRATNSLINQYFDAINMDLYKILKVRSTGVQMHTLRWAPGEKWIMNDPSTDVQELQTNAAGVSEFTQTYSFMISAMQNALGETSVGVSNLGTFQGDKTATEIQDLAMQRNARDNFNAIFLAEALKKQMMFWHLMNRQLLFKNEKERYKVIRIVGKDAIRYFQMAGLDQTAIDDETAELLASPELADVNISPEELSLPSYPVKTEDGSIPQFSVEPTGEVGSLIIEEDDCSGTYDYIPDIESMQIPDDRQVLAIKKQMIELAQNPETIQVLASEGYKIKLKEVMEDFFEQIGLKDAERYFERVEQPQPVDPTGAGGMGAGLEGQGLAGQPGMAGGTPPVPGVQVQ